MFLRMALRNLWRYRRRMIVVLLGIFVSVLAMEVIGGMLGGMRPAVILLSLSIWGSLMGIIGMIIALPMTTLILSYYKRWVIRDSITTGTVEDDTSVAPTITQESEPAG